MKSKQTNWSTMDEEAIYDAFDELDTPEESAEMLWQILQHKPVPEIEFIEMFQEVAPILLFEHKPEWVEKIVEAYKNNLPLLFIEDYQYLLRDLLGYYFFIGNIERIEHHLGFVMEHPVPGVDLITLPVLWKLIYNGYYNQAVDFSLSVWKTLHDDEQIWGDAHSHFCVTIYLHELEQAWLQLQKNEPVEVSEFYNRTDKIFEIDETSENKQVIFYCLQNPFSKDEITEHIKRKEYRQANLKMNIWFLVYMKQNFGVPFILSDRWWSILATPKVFGTNGLDNYWYIPYNALDEHFFNNTDTMLGSNTTEIFGKARGLEYVYHFVHNCGLISDGSFTLMKENITALNYVYTTFNFTDLWQFNFIFKWPQLNETAPSLEACFNETFALDYSQTEAFINHQHAIFDSLRPGLQKEVKKKNRELFGGYFNFNEDADYENEELFGGDYSYFGETYVREGPKTGRNEPCPCGSRKKYKKCCLNK